MSDKMCGNCCSKEHKYVDCPVQDLQFPLTKIELKELREKAQKLDWILPWLKDNLPEEQLKLLSVIMDEECRKILAYLVSTEKTS